MPPSREPEPWWVLGLVAVGAGATLAGASLVFTSIFDRGVIEVRP